MIMIPLRIAIAFVACNHGVGFSSAFVVRPHLTTARRAITRTQIFSSKVVEGDETTTEDKTSKMMTLSFVGETVISSDAAAVDSSKSLHDFFALPHAVPLILRGSKNNEIHELETVDAELLQQYEKICDKLNASPPTSGERFFDVTTSGVKFPGLEVMSVVTIGVKTILTDDFPSYELVLIRDDNYAEGNRLFIWFFNKVTGKDKNKDDPSQGKEQTTFSVNRISVVPQEGNGMISFESHAYLNLLIKFPAFLMKAVPGASKEKFEKSGGASLQKVLDDDLPAALEGFRQEYIRWLES